MDHINFPYRSSSHLALMHVIQESGAWERNGLVVDYEKIISRGDAHELVPKGKVEFVSGNHVSTYARRAQGDTWAYLGQTVSKNHLALVTRQDTGIEKIADCRNRKFGSRGKHPFLNTWLYLKQAGLDADLDQVEIITKSEASTDGKPGRRKDLVDMVADRDVDACFLSQPRIEFARRKGLKVIPVPPQSMVFFMTLSSSMKMVQDHPDVVTRVCKAVLEGIAYFKTNREGTIKILIDRHKTEGVLDRDAAEKLYNDLAPVLEPKLIPSLEAIGNVYQEALKQDGKKGDAARIHPLELWDFHFLRDIENTGFIRNLYKDRPELLNGHGG